MGNSKGRWGRGARGASVMESVCHMTSPQCIKGSSSSESSCQEGEREQGEGGARSLFFFFFVSYLHSPPPSSPLPPSVI